MASVEQQLAFEEQKREKLTKTIEALRQGSSLQAEEDRVKLVEKLEQLRDLTSGRNFEALSAAIMAMGKIVDSPVLTCEASRIIVEGFNKFLEDSASELQQIRAVIDTFISKYSVELDAQITTRRKEEEVLSQLAAYLSRYI